MVTVLAAHSGTGRWLPLVLPVPRHRRWSTPARTKGQAAGVVALACCLAALTAVLLSQLHGEFEAIRQTDAPEADAAAGLYFALNDMDAQVANVLLVRGSPALAARQSANLATYAGDRSAASRDLEQAMVAEAGDAGAERQLSGVLDRIGQYEALAASALLPGQRPNRAVASYREATDLMQASILPAVDSLTSVGSARVNAAYQGGGTAVRAGIAAVLAVGLLLAAALIALQVHLARRFRRRLSPALAAATLLVIAFAALTAARFSAESRQLTVAKQDAFDSIGALSLARALSYDANADESRYLVDPGRAARYQRAFLSKSQQIANVGPVSLSGYDAALAADIAAYQRDHSDVRFGGFLGAEFRNITFPGERQAATAALLAFQRYERDDATLRALAAGHRAAAVGYDTGTAPTQSDGAFNRYDAALSSVIALNAAAFAAALRDGEADAGGYLALAALTALLVAGLTYAGVRPRLAEYR